MNSYLETNLVKQSKGGEDAQSKNKYKYSQSNFHDNKTEKSQNRQPTTEKTSKTIKHQTTVKQSNPTELLQFNDYMDVITDGVVLFDSELSIVKCNQQSLQYFGAQNEADLSLVFQCEEFKKVKVIYSSIQDIPDLNTGNSIKPNLQSPNNNGSNFNNCNTNNANSFNNIIGSNNVGPRDPAQDQLLVEKEWPETNSEYRKNQDVPKIPQKSNISIFSGPNNTLFKYLTFLQKYQNTTENQRILISVKRFRAVNNSSKYYSHSKLQHSQYHQIQQQQQCQQIQQQQQQSQKEQLQQQVVPHNSPGKSKVCDSNQNELDEQESPCRNSNQQFPDTISRNRDYVHNCASENLFNLQSSEKWNFHNESEDSESSQELILQEIHTFRPQQAFKNYFECEDIDSVGSRSKETYSIIDRPRNNSFSSPRKGNSFCTFQKLNSIQNHTEKQSQRQDGAEPGDVQRSSFSQDQNFLIHIKRLSFDKSAEQNKQRVMFVVCIISKDQNQQLIQQLKQNFLDFKLFLFHSITHDFLTPLSCVNALLEQLYQQKQISSQIKEEYLQPVIYNNELLNNITKDLLDYQIIENGCLKLEFQNINTYQLFEYSFLLYQHQAKIKKLDYLFDFDQNTPKTIRSDPDRIKQVIRNLLHNAFKNTYQGTITLKVQRFQENDIMIKISDTGIGLTKHDINKMKLNFQSLFSNNLKKNNLFSGRGRNFGFGILISQYIARGLSKNRPIDIQSELNQGSQFSFYIKNWDQNQKGISLCKKYGNNYNGYYNSSINQDNQAQTQYSSLSLINFKYIDMDQKNSKINANSQPNINMQSSVNANASQFQQRSQQQQQLAIQPQQPLSSTSNKQFVSQLSGYQRIESKKKINAELSRIIIEQNQKCEVSDDQNCSSITNRNILSPGYNTNNANCNPIQRNNSLKDIKSQNSQENSSLCQRKSQCLNIQVSGGQRDGSRISNSQNTDPMASEHNTPVLQNMVTTPQLPACNHNQILIVDDDKYNILALSTIINTFHLSTDSATNGKQAVDMTLQRYNNCKICKGYKIIIMDVDMPVMNGYDASECIVNFFNQKEEACKPAIIIHTAFQQQNDQNILKKLGILYNLPKPIKPYQLKDIINKHFFNSQNQIQQ